MTGRPTDALFRGKSLIDLEGAPHRLTEARAAPCLHFASPKLRRQMWTLHPVAALAESAAAISEGVRYPAALALDKIAAAPVDLETLAAMKAALLEVKRALAARYVVEA